MNVAEVLVRCFEQCEVPYIFGVPGEETLDLMEALRNSSIRFIATRHEQGAAFMAATYGRLTGKPGILMTTLGPGALNAMTGIAYAHLGQMPLLLISGQKPIHEIKQGNFQMIDVVDAMQSITTASQRLTKADAAPSLIFSLLHEATRFPFGPVHVELAEDVAKQNVSEHLLDLQMVKANAAPAPEKEDIEVAAALINSAAKPMLLCGQHSSREDVAAALKTFVEHSDIPFASTQMGKGALNEDHPLYLGCTALSEHDYVHKMAQDSDLLIVIGHNESEKPPLMACCHRQKVLHIHDIAPSITETYFPSHALVGDLCESIKSLATKVEKRTQQSFRPLQERFFDHEKELAQSAAPLQIVEQVRRAMPDDGIVALDNGMYKIWFARHYRARARNTLLLDNALATMGAGLASAIAAKLVYPDKQVLAVCGDGGFIMGGQDFETAKRLQLDLVVLILRDDKFGMIRWKQQTDGYEDFGMDFGNPDFAMLAKSYGAGGHKVTDIQDLGDTIAQCQQSGGLHLIETAIDYSADSIFNDLENITS